MVQNKGGQRVKGGAYVNMKDGEWVSFPKEGGVLPGTEQDQYLRTPVALIAAPILGLVYLIFLPLAGFVMGGGLLIWRGITGLTRSGRQATAHAPQNVRR